jgi:cytochrome c2
MIRASAFWKSNPIKVSHVDQAARVLLVIAAISVPTFAQAADPARGRDLALRWCSSCHLVSEEQQIASSVSTPSFYDIARDPDWSQEKLETFLINPHPRMPDMSLGTIEITNLAAYIGSLAP